MHFAHAIRVIHGRFDSMDNETKRKVVKITACVAGVVAVGKICSFAYNYIDGRRTRSRKLEQIRVTKGKLLQKLVGLEKPVENRDTITRMTYEDLKKQIQNGQLKAIDVLEAYQAKAMEVDRTLNCITDVIYDADVTALYLDSLPKENRGHLHGIPLSIKDNIKFAEYDAYSGCVSNCFKPEKETAYMVQALIKEGMVPFVRTNMSQLGACIDCANPLFGETLNPHDHKRTCGGSSGGEGAIIGGRASIVGIGSDIGGSIRIPSHYCGIYGFKPTVARIGTHNTKSTKFSTKPLTYTCSAGPMSSDLDLLVDVMKVIFSPAYFNLDETVPKVNFINEDYESNKPMKIGYYKSFSDNNLTVEPVPAVQRAIEEAKAGLIARGHTLVEWEPPRIASACDLLVRFLLIDGGVGSHKFIHSEPFVSTEMWQLGIKAGMPLPFKYITAIISWPFCPLLSRYVLRSIPPRTSYDVVRLMVEADDYKEECRRSWKDAGLDGVICPVLPFAAPLCRDTFEIMYGLLYCNIYNFLDYPAGVVPVTRVTEEDIDALRTTYRQNSKTERKVVKTQVASIGMPVGVQCVAMTLHDEKALRLMKEVKSSI